MSGLINELIDIVTQELELYEKLVLISSDKKDFIINNDIVSLKNITSQENTIAGKLRRLEKKRIFRSSDIANVLNEKESNITLTHLANIISEDSQSEKLNSLAQRLKNSVSYLKDSNEQNRVLIENALDYIDFSINVIRNSIDDSPTIFSATGEEYSSGRNLFDVKN